MAVGTCFVIEINELRVCIRGRKHIKKMLAFLIFYDPPYIVTQIITMSEKNDNAYVKEIILDNIC